MCEGVCNCNFHQLPRGGELVDVPGRGLAATTRMTILYLSHGKGGARYSSAMVNHWLTTMVGCSTCTLLRPIYRPSKALPASFEASCSRPCCITECLQCACDSRHLAVDGTDVAGPRTGTLRFVRCGTFAEKFMTPLADTSGALLHES